MLTIQLVGPLWGQADVRDLLEAIGLNGGAVPPALAQRLRRLHSSQKHLLNGVLFNRVKVRTDDRTPTLRSLWI